MRPMERCRILAAALSLAAAVCATTAMNDASADLPILAAPHSLNALQPTWSVTSALGLDAPAAPKDSSLSSYSVMASLPFAESVVRTYDVKRVVNKLIDNKVELGDGFRLTFITGRHLLVADLGARTTFMVTPTSMSGGVFAIGGAF